MSLFWEICINIISGFRCESGVWLGKFSPCSPSGNTLEEITAAGYDMPCILDPLPEESRLVMFYQDKEVVDQVEVPAGEDITVRCSDIGKYRLEVMILNSTSVYNDNTIFGCRARSGGGVSGATLTAGSPGVSDSTRCTTTRSTSRPPCCSGTRTAPSPRATLESWWCTPGPRSTWSVSSSSGRGLRSGRHAGRPGTSIPWSVSDLDIISPTPMFDRVGPKVR